LCFWFKRALRLDWGFMITEPQSDRKNQLIRMDRGRLFAAIYGIF